MRLEKLHLDCASPAPSHHGSTHQWPLLHRKDYLQGSEIPGVISPSRLVPIIIAATSPEPMATARLRLGQMAARAGSRNNHYGGSGPGRRRRPGDQPDWLGRRAAGSRGQCQRAAVRPAATRPAGHPGGRAAERAEPTRRPQAKRRLRFTGKPASVRVTGGRPGLGPDNHHVVVTLLSIIIIITVTVTVGGLRVGLDLPVKPWTHWHDGLRTPA
jgi:hypothetical protein